MPNNPENGRPKSLKDIQSSDWYKNLPRQRQNGAPEKTSGKISDIVEPEKKKKDEAQSRTRDYGKSAPSDSNQKNPQKEKGSGKKPGPVNKPVEGLGAHNRPESPEKPEPKPPKGNDPPSPPPPRRPFGAPTNAGHYYYVKGEAPGRDFGRKMDKYSIWQLLGTPEKPLDDIRIHGVAYHDYFRSPAATNSFDLTTTYPGLLVGTGYMHPIPPKEKEEEPGDFQSGFYFDWSTGLPVIPGSTVKGVLRSVFPKKSNSPKKGDSTEIKEEKNAYLSGILGDIIKQEIPDPAAFVEALEKALFVDRGSAYFDAYICGVPQYDRHEGKIFSEDYITPHKDDPFLDPIPLRFLKISPDVIFRFQFRLTTIEPGKISIKPGHLKEFFKTILTDFGIGAKRNTGFGALVEETG